jgi:glyoxylase-like metal-dependent hydrolase (beta-lactamase superfamily II)
VQPTSTDVHWLDRAQVICAWRIGETLVDPGPTSTLGAVLGALEGATPRRVLLTHIHLDHAASAGTLARRFPDLEVWVHERGAPHLADPARLLASARTLWGEDMERLWGEVLPVPEERLRVLRGGERRDGFRVAATPGHASHHVAYLHEDSGYAFVGDVAGVRIGAGALVLPPTPPPGVDLAAWRSSLELVGAWSPTALAITHFGEHRDHEAHLDRARVGLERWGELARRTDGAGYAAALRAAVAAGADAERARAYEQAMPPEQQWAGLARYWARLSSTP